MKYLALLFLFALPVFGQTHVYVCAAVPTTIQGAPSSACSAEQYLLPAAVLPTHYLAACGDTVVNCDWSQASWRRVDATAGSALAWMTSGPGEISSRFARKDTLLGTTPVPPDPPVAGSALLTWTAPTTNTDDSPLTDLAGFKVYRGTTAGGPYPTTQLVGAGTTSVTITGLPAGTHYFVVTALNTAGNESVFSGEASKTVTGTPPPPTDPCVLRPFTFRVRSWPGGVTGDRSIGYSTNKALASLAYTSTATRVTGIDATDTEGCVVRVSR